ncbi:HEAT repeat domain-containing protein [Candidatus Desantisbacteria bacterium]|nr:HEAT repeat domain-containing protein [Candidatus Desantisbacteria bacterium]
MKNFRWIIIVVMIIGGLYTLYHLSEKHEDKKKQIVLKKTYLEVEKYSREIEAVCKKANSLEEATKLIQHRILWIDTIGKPAAPVLIKEFRNKKKDLLFRIVMAELLAMTMNPAVVPEVIKVANDPAELMKIRISAVVVLGKINDESAVLALEEMLNKEVLEIQMPAAYALGEIRSEEAIDILNEKLLKGGCDPSLEKEIKIALAKKGTVNKDKGPWWPGKEGK